MLGKHTSYPLDHTCIRGIFGVKGVPVSIHPYSFPSTGRGGRTHGLLLVRQALIPTELYRYMWHLPCRWRVRDLNPCQRFMRPCWSRSSPTRSRKRKTRTSPLPPEGSVLPITPRSRSGYPLLFRVSMRTRYLSAKDMVTRLGTGHFHEGIASHLFVYPPR